MEKTKKLISLIREWLQVYLPTVRCCSPKTIESYRQAINLFLDFLENKKHIKVKCFDYNCFSRTYIEEWLAWLIMERECSKRTRDHRLTCVRSLMEYIQSKDKNILSNYLEICDIKNISHGKGKIIEGVSKDMMNLFFKSISTDSRIGIRDMAMFMLMYDTGCRVGEVIGLKIKDLFLEDSNPYVIVNGKGDKKRTLLLSSKTIKAIKRYLECMFGTQLSPNYYVFFSTHKGRFAPITTDAINCRLNSIAKIANSKNNKFPKHFHSHQLRHSAATHWYQDGINLAIISKYLGHEQIETTQIYLGISREELEKALSKREDVLDYVDLRYKNANGSLRSLI